MAKYIPVNAYDALITDGEIYLKVGIANHADEPPYMDVMKTLIISHTSLRHLVKMLNRLVADLDAGRAPNGEMSIDGQDVEDKRGANDEA